MLHVVNISLLVTEDCDVVSCIISHTVGVNLFTYFQQGHV